MGSTAAPDDRKFYQSFPGYRRKAADTSTVLYILVSVFSILLFSFFALLAAGFFVAIFMLIANIGMLIAIATMLGLGANMALLIFVLEVIHPLIRTL